LDVLDVLEVEEEREVDEFDLLTGFPKTDVREGKSCPVNSFFSTFVGAQGF
jgi:hypothetical protein